MIAGLLRSVGRLSTDVSEQPKYRNITKRTKIILKVDKPEVEPLVIPAAKKKTASFALEAV